MAPLRLVFWRPLLAKVGPTSVFIVVRRRYGEDVLQQAIRTGCRQVVILGAGLDSWALRHDGSQVTVFELDHPATQGWKETRLRLFPAHFSHVAG